MNKIVMIGLAVLLLVGIVLFAFMNVSNEKIVEETPAPLSEPAVPSEPEPEPALPVIYKGTIVELQDGRVLTTGVEGIIGSVVVHLPESYDTNLLPEVGEELTIRYNGTIAESEPVQIWAQDVVLSEEDLIPIPDLPEEPKLPPVAPNTVRFTIENTLQSISAGKSFEVILDVNPTTGYQTEITYPNALVLESDVYIMKSKSSALVGAGSIRILQFTAETAGTFAIECEVKAPSGDHVHTYTIEVEVLPEP